MEGLNKIDDQWISLQIKVFSRWVSNQIQQTPNMKIDDITKDLSNGVVLCYLAQNLTKKQAPRKWYQDPIRNVDKVQNCELAVDMFQKDGVKIIGISGKDINDNNEKLILGLIWSLISHYTIGQSIKNDDFKDNNNSNIIQNNINDTNKPADKQASIGQIQVKQTYSNKNQKEALLSWGQERVQNYPNISGFAPYELVLCALLDSYVPDKINYYSLDPKQPKENLKLATNVMKEIGIPVYVYPEELSKCNNKVDEKTLLTQLASAKNVLDKKVFISEPPKEQLPEKIQEKKVDNILITDVNTSSELLSSSSESEASKSDNETETEDQKKEEEEEKEEDKEEEKEEEEDKEEEKEEEDKEEDKEEEDKEEDKEEEEKEDEDKEEEEKEEDKEEEEKEEDKEEEEKEEDKEEEEKEEDKEEEEKEEEDKEEEKEEDKEREEEEEKKETKNTHSFIKLASKGILINSTSEIGTTSYGDSSFNDTNSEEDLEEESESESSSSEDENLSTRDASLDANINRKPNILDELAKDYHITDSTIKDFIKRRRNDQEDKLKLTAYADDKLPWYIPVLGKSKFVQNRTNNLLPYRNNKPNIIEELAKDYKITSKSRENINPNINLSSTKKSSQQIHRSGRLNRKMPPLPPMRRLPVKF